MGEYKFIVSNGNKAHEFSFEDSDTAIEQALRLMEQLMETGKFNMEVAEGTVNLHDGSGEKEGLILYAHADRGEGVPLSPGGGIPVALLFGVTMEEFLKQAPPPDGKFNSMLQ